MGAPVLQSHVESLSGTSAAALILSTRCRLAGLARLPQPLRSRSYPKGG